MNADDMNRIREATLFEGVSPEEIATALGETRTRDVAEAGSVFAEGDESRCAYLVLEGEVGIRTHILDEGEGGVPFRPIIVKLGPGQVVGEFALLDARPRSAEAFAILATRLLILDGQWLDALSRQNPALAYRILSNLTRMVVSRVRDTNAKLCGALEWGWKARGLDRN